MRFKKKRKKLSKMERLVRIISIIMVTIMLGSIVFGMLFYIPYL